MSRFLLVSRTRSHKNLEKVLCRLKTFSLVGDDLKKNNTNIFRFEQIK